MEISQNFRESIIQYGIRVAIGLVILLVGLAVIKVLIGMLEKFLQASRLNESLHGFIKSLTSFGLNIILIITVLGLLGIPMATFVAILGAAGLAIGFALRDSLGNIAGGIIILSSRPFNVGDFISAQGEMGTVKEILILHTRLVTPDNKKVVIPNGPLANGNITNFSAEELRRVDLTYGVGYEDDIMQVKGILTELIENHELTLKEPEAMVRVIEYGDSSVNFTVRVWCKKEDYWSIYYDLQEAVKMRFDEENINIPYPQMDLHVNQLSR
jgi:small conductance mechanosensitive channel